MLSLSGAAEETDDATRGPRSSGTVSGMAWYRREDTPYLQAHMPREETYNYPHWIADHGKRFVTAISISIRHFI